MLASSTSSASSQRSYGPTSAGAQNDAARLSIEATRSLLAKFKASQIVFESYKSEADVRAKLMQEQIDDHANRIQTMQAQIDTLADALANFDIETVIATDDEKKDDQMPQLSRVEREDKVVDKSVKLPISSVSAEKPSVNPSPSIKSDSSMGYPVQPKAVSFAGEARPASYYLPLEPTKPQQNGRNTPSKLVATPSAAFALPPPPSQLLQGSAPDSPARYFSEIPVASPATNSVNPTASNVSPLIKQSLQSNGVQHETAVRQTQETEVNITKEGEMSDSPGGFVEALAGLQRPIIPESEGDFARRVEAFNMEATRKVSQLKKLHKHLEHKAQDQEQMALVLEDHEKELEERLMKVQDREQKAQRIMDQATFKSAGRKQNEIDAQNYRRQEDAQAMMKEARYRLELLTLAEKQ